MEMVGKSWVLVALGMCVSFGGRGESENDYGRHAAYKLSMPDFDLPVLRRAKNIQKVG